ncbi:MAG TPA: peptidylprolyl isomerase [Bacteroidota bacterium]|nr:peptidylprolyl isomerase [Bacteroidota bacterium]
MNRSARVAAGAIAAAMAALLLCAIPAASQNDTLDRIVALVGKEAIFLSDLKAQTEFYALSNRINPETPGLKEQVLDAMINEKLVLAQALRDTALQVTEDQVTARLDELIAQRIAHPQVGSQQKLEELYGMPVSRMKREFRDEMRKQILAQQLQQVRFDGVTVSRREVEEFFTTYKDSLPEVPGELELYHIFRFPRVNAGMRDAIMQKARAVLDSIRAGGDFAGFANRYSEDKATSGSGGDLGFWKRGEFVPDFEEIVFSLKERELSGIVETSRGFHIIQLMERRGDKVNARHILFRAQVDSTSTSDAASFLRSLKDSVTAGVPFSELAKKYSDDKESGPLGGLIGRLTADQFDPELVRVADSLDQGEISDPVELTSGNVRGMHLVCLKERIPEHAMNPAQDWKRLEEMALGYKRNIEYQKWLLELRGQLFWEVRL